MHGMKRVGWLLLGLLLVGLLPAGAQGPDDRFIEIYGLIQQGDALAAAGRSGESRERYREALTRLRQFEQEFPKWNPRILEYRRQYLEDRAGVPSLTRTPAEPAAPGTPERPADPRLTALLEEVQQLKGERDLLQAKLREALSPQPAALDPQELAKVQDRATALQREAESLRSALAAKERELAEAARPARLDEAEQALAAARLALGQQSNTVATLAQEKAALQQRLDQAIERAATQPPAQTRTITNVVTTVVTNVVTNVQPAPDAQAAQQVAAANIQIRELRDRIRVLEGDLATEQARAQSYQKDRQALEQQVANLKQAARSTPTPVASVATPPAEPVKPAPAATEPPAPKPAPPVTAVAAPAPAPEDPKREKSLAKYQRESDKLKIQQLERERDELSKRLRVMTRQLEDVRRQVGGTNVTSGTDQLAILRARLEAYEARSVPYSPEEIALMKATAEVNIASDSKSSSRPLRQIPAGAATLLEEAKHAFILRRYDTAEGKLQQALQLDERNADMLTYLAAAQLEQDRLDQAEATLKRALDVDPQNPDGVSLMGLLRFRQGKFDQAFDLLSQAAQLNPDNPYTQNYLGVTLNQRGQRKPAETALRRAIALDPNYGEAHANLAAVYALQQPPFLELARWHYEKALALGAKKNPEIEKLLAAAPSASSPKP